MESMETRIEPATPACVLFFSVRVQSHLYLPFFSCPILKEVFLDQISFLCLTSTSILFIFDYLFIGLLIGTGSHSSPCLIGVHLAISDHGYSASATRVQS